MEYWQKDIETMGRDQLQELQLTRLKETVKHAANSPFYKEVFEKNGITPDSIQTLDDLRKIPFTTKNDLRSHYPFGMAAIPIQKCVRIHSSSGTTGNPTVVLHSAKDLDQWANQVARCMYMVGLRDTDVFQNTSGYGMFTGGLGFQYGAELLGALTVPAAAGNTIRQIKFIRDFGTTAMHAIPSYVFRLYEVMQELNIDPRKDTKLKTLVIGAEPHTDAQRRKIEEILGVKAYNSFGMSEMSGPGVAFECTEQNGLHLWEDSYIMEIINPDTLEPVPDGEVGELVLTTLAKRAMPILRYRTHDITSIITMPCKCGRTLRRIRRIGRRSDDMFIIRGVNVFPSQIEVALMRVEECTPNYRIILERLKDLDTVTVEVEVADEFYTDSISQLDALRKKIQTSIMNITGIRIEVRIVEPNKIPRSEGKAKRVIDNRKI